MWRNLVHELPDFHTIAVDAPGTGSSTSPAAPLSMAGLARVYAAMVRRLDLPQVTVVGLSYGGAVAQELAHHSPEFVSGLVLCGIGPGAGESPGSLLALVELASPWRYYSASQARHNAPLLYGGRSARDFASFSRELGERRTSPPSVYGYYCQLAALVGWTGLPWLASLNAPALVIAGDQDPVYPLANAKLLGRLRYPTPR